MRAEIDGSGRLRRLRRLSGFVLVGLVAVPVSATARPSPTQVPKVVQIEDVAGDANYVANQMGGADFLGLYPQDARNRQTPADTSGAADILDVWFSNDATTVSVYFHTETPPPGEIGYLYRLYAVPYDVGAGIRGMCLDFAGYVPGEVNGAATTYHGTPKAEFADMCPQRVATKGEIRTEALRDGTGLVILTFPRSASPYFSTGAKITDPYAASRHVTGKDNLHVLIPTVDDTAVGKTYVVKKR